MKKMPSLFARDYENPQHEDRKKKGRFLATPVVTPGCEWVIAGEGIATRKWDGTAILYKNDIWWKRYDAKHGKKPPEEFMAAQDEADPITGHWPGWLPVQYDDPADQWIAEAIYRNDASNPMSCPEDGSTYEAIGPKIGGNKDGASMHLLMKHGVNVLMRGYKFLHTFDGIREYLSFANPHIEGIVFHHPDGRMCKVKRSDFGLPW